MMMMMVFSSRVVLFLLSLAVLGTEQLSVPSSAKSYKDHCVFSAKPADHEQTSFLLRHLEENESCNLLKVKTNRMDNNIQLPISTRQSADIMRKGKTWYKKVALQIVFDSFINIGM